MIDEKITGADGNGAAISDKLSDAARALSDADADARARREEEARLATEKERQLQLQSEEAERARIDEERRNSELLRKKQAELEYAESFRRRLREERARVESAARSRRSAEQRERRAKEADEEAQRLVREHHEQELAEAQRRNSETDSLLRITAMRIEEREAQMAELRERIKNAHDAREAMEAEEMLHRLEEVGTEPESIILTAQELGIDTEGAADNAHAEAADTDAGAGEALTDSESADNAANTEQDESTPESADTDNGDDDYIISIEAQDADGVYVKARTEKSAPGYRFSGSTVSIIGASDALDGYAKKRKMQESTLSRYRNAEGGAVLSVRRSDDASGYSYAAASDGAYGYENEHEVSEKADAIGSLADTADEGGTDEITITAAASTDKISELAKEKYRLEEQLQRTEAENQAAIAQLTDKEHEAQRRLLAAEYAAKEQEYLDQIDELNRRLLEVERAHDEKRGVIEGSILKYETECADLEQSQTRSKELTEQQELERETARIVNETQIQSLNTSELSRLLNKRDAEERRILGKISSKRRTYDRAKREGEDQISHLYAVIKYNGELLSSYIISYKYTLAASHKAYARSYSKKITDLVKQFNADLEAWQRLTVTETDSIPTTLAEDIKAGAEIGAIPTVLMPDIDAKQQQQQQDDFSIAEANMRDEESMVALTAKELDAFLEKNGKRERELSSKLTSLERSRGAGKGDKLKAYLKDYIAVSGELLSLYIADYKAIIASNATKYKRKYKGFVASLTEKHNKALEAWKALSDTPIELMPADCAARIERGEDVPTPMTSVLSTDTSAPEKPTGEREELDEHSRKSAEQDGLYSMSERDLSAFLNKSDAKERSLINEASAKRREAERESGEDKLLALKACIDTEVELIERVINAYRATVACASRHKRSYASKLDGHVKQYNKDVAAWQALTDTAVTVLPEDLSKRIANGDDTERIDTVYLPDKIYPSAASDKSTPRSLREENDEKRRIYEEEQERERQARAAKPKRKKQGDRESTVGDSHMKYDIATLEAKIDYRRDRFSRFIEESQLRYGETDRKQTRRISADQRKLRAIRSLARSAIRYESSCNSRYLNALHLSAASLGTESNAKADRIEELQKRIEELLHERDDINIRLCSLYREEDASGKKMRRKSYRANLAAARLRAARSAYRKCASSAREVSRFRVSIQEKSKAYEAMNKKIEFSAYLAECRYRMSHEKPRGAQRRKLNAEIRDTQKRIRDMDADIRFHTDKLGRRSAKVPKTEGQIAWLLVLILIVGIGFAIYWFRAPIWEFLKSIISLNKVT